MSLQSRQASGKQAMIQSANQAVGAGVAGGTASWYLTNADMASIHDDAEIAIGFNAVSSLITLTSGEVAKMLPDGDTPYHARVWEPGDRTTYEIVLVTDVTGDVLTVLRGREGTTAQAWTSAALIRVRNDVAVNYKVGITPNDGATIVAPLEILFCTAPLTIVHVTNFYSGAPFALSRLIAFDTATGSVEWDYIAPDSYERTFYYPVAKPSASYFAVGAPGAVYIHSLTDGSLVRTVTPYSEISAFNDQIAGEIVEGADKILLCVRAFNAEDGADANRIFITETTISTGAQNDYEIEIDNAFDATSSTPEFGLACYFDEGAIVVNKNFHEVSTGGYVESAINPIPWWTYPASASNISADQGRIFNPTGQNDTDFYYVTVEFTAPGVGESRLVACSKADFGQSEIYSIAISGAYAKTILHNERAITHCSDHGLICRERTPQTATFYTSSGARLFSPYVARIDGAGDYSTRLIPDWFRIAAPDGDTISFITPDYDKVRNYVQEQNP